MFGSQFIHLCRARDRKRHNLAKKSAGIFRNHDIVPSFCSLVVSPVTHGLVGIVARFLLNWPRGMSCIFIQLYTSIYICVCVYVCTVTKPRSCRATTKHLGFKRLFVTPVFFVSLLSLPCREVDKAKRAVLELQLRDWQCRSRDRLPGRPTCAILQSWPLRSCIFCGFVQAAGAINVVSSSSVLPECCTASSRVCRTEGGASGAGIEARVRNNCQQPEQRQGTSPDKDTAPARKTKRTSWEPEENVVRKGKSKSGGRRGAERGRYSESGK